MKQKIMYLVLLALLLISCGEISVAVELTDTPSFQLPDLVVSSINVAMVDANGRCVEGYQLFTSILNQGNAPAEGVTAVEMTTGHTFIIGRLEAGQKMDLQIPASASSGTYLVNVDPENVISESNETNNNLSYLLATPTPYAGCLSIPSNDATPLPPPVSAPSLSMDGLFYADMNRAVIEKVANGGHVLDLISGTSAHFSADGLQLLLDSTGDILLAEPMDNPGINLTNTPDVLEISPQWWSANPSKIIFNRAGINEAQEKGWTHTYAGYLAMINRDGSEYVTLSDVASFGKPALSPDGMTIAYDTNGWPMLYRLGSGSQAFDPGQYGFMGTPTQGIYFTNPSFSPDGRWLTWWVTQDETVPDRGFSLVLFDLMGTSNVIAHSYKPLAMTLGWLDNPIWSPDGQWIAFQTRSEVTPWDLWIVHRDGGIGQRLGLATNAVWSPDSQHVAYVQLPPRADSYLAASLSIIDVPSWFVQQTSLPVGSIPLAWK